MLAIVVDHKFGFTGSRTIDQWGIEDEDNIERYLRNEFPGITFDDVLFVQNDNIIAEWIHRE